MLSWRLGAARMVHIPAVLVWHEGSASAATLVFYERFTAAGIGALARKLARSSLEHATLLAGRVLGLGARAAVRALKPQPSAFVSLAGEFTAHAKRVGYWRKEIHLDRADHIVRQALVRCTGTVGLCVRCECIVITKARHRVANDRRQTPHRRLSRLRVAATPQWPPQPDDARRSDGGGDVTRCRVATTSAARVAVQWIRSGTWFSRQFNAQVAHDGGDALAQCTLSRSAQSQAHREAGNARATRAASAANRSSGQRRYSRLAPGASTQ